MSRSSIYVFECIYICKNKTLANKIDNMKYKNSMDLRISIYEAAKKLDKKNKIEKQREDKVNKLKSKMQNLDLFQIINITAILCVLQIIASLAKTLVI